MFSNFNASRASRSAVGVGTFGSFTMVKTAWHFVQEIITEKARVVVGAQFQVINVGHGHSWYW